MMQEYDIDEMDIDSIVIVRKKNRGRPKNKTARNKVITIRMTEPEEATLKDMTAYYDISRSDLVRRALVIYDRIMGRNR